MTNVLSLVRSRLVHFILLAGAVDCGGSSPTGPTPPPIPSYVSCSVFPDYRTAMYVLPWAVGGRFRVNRSFEHYDLALNGGVGLYAIDFGLSLGTPVHAARAGTVAAVEERFSDDDRADYHENWVMIRHADGTIGRYIHLTMNGALVEVGDRVIQGQQIGRSGNSGPSNGPHLHFDVQTCGPNLPPSYNRAPCGMTVPVSFRNTVAHSCGVESTSSYSALPFTADER